MESVKKQMFKWLIRGIIVFFGGILVSRNKISQETLDLFANDLLSHLVGIVLLVVAAVEVFFKAKKDKRVENVAIEEATKADPNTPISLVKERVKEAIQKEVKNKIKNKIRKL